MSTDDMPPQPKTKELPAADPVQVLLLQLKNTVEARFDKTDADLESVKNEGQRTGMRLTRVEMRLDDVETRLTRNSGAVKEASKADLSHEAQLAQERIAREALALKVDALAHTNETQLAILSRLDSVAKNPLVKTVGAMLATALITWLATHGVHVPQ